MKYRERAAAEIATARPAETVTPIMRKLVDDTGRLLARAPADARARASAARAHAVDHLEELHSQVRSKFEARGVGYHRAADAAEAEAIVRALLGPARRVAKSKSMVAEEVGLTHALRGAGIDVLETDIGEYIVDIEGRGPSHITAPALHLNRSRIRELLARTGAELPDDDPGRLSRYVRDVVGDYFHSCDAAITGANAVVASSGRIVIVENEGNVSLGVSHPKLHIVITGLEKVLADEAGALAMLEVLAPSATGQPLTAFTHFLAGPAPGQERHVVFVDNGRSRILADERYRDVLRCIRCGACMNTCPVYRAAGGLSYGSPYMGPIGAIVSPLLWPSGRYADLPFASSLCGACTVACPVGIPLHRMLLDLRGDAVTEGHAGGWAERAAWRAWAAALGRPAAAKLALKAGRTAARVGGRWMRMPGAGDPRRLPPVEPERHRDQLQPGHEPHPRESVPIIESPGSDSDDLLALFKARVEDLGAEVRKRPRKREGDLVVAATAAIASTGSVLLCGEAADRRRLLHCTRLLVQVDPATIVRYPSDLAAGLGHEDALILTGGSRTADIEKQIVRGIHGPEALTILAP